MKYEIELTKSESKTIRVFAENRDQALEIARKDNPGFDAEYVSELLDEDLVGETHVVLGACESCEKIIWDGENYGEDEDGVRTCENCIEPFVRKETSDDQTI